MQDSSKQTRPAYYCSFNCSGQKSDTGTAFGVGFRATGPSLFAL